MKQFATIVLLALLASTLVAQEEPASVKPAATYPDFPTLAKLMASQAAIAEFFPQVTHPAQLPQVAARLGIPSVPVMPDPIKLAQSVQLPVAAPPTATADPVKIAQSVQPLVVSFLNSAGNPAQLGHTHQRPSIAGLDKATAPDVFAINRLFNWGKPHGQWMNQMLKDIEAARKAGDMETYTTLTARYTAWAEKYLHRDSPPKLDGNPGH